MVTKDIVATVLLLVIVEGFCQSADNLKLLHRTVDYQKNITIPCAPLTESGEEFARELDLDRTGNNGELMWVREGREDQQISRMSVKPNGSLVLTSLSRDDADIYRCTVVRENREKELEDFVRVRVKVDVRVPPPALANVSIAPSTVLALLLWEVKDTGGYDIDYFSARYRLKDAPDTTGRYHSETTPDSYHWHWVVPEHIKHDVREIDVYQLEPNSTYVFQIWATNQLGPGEITQIETHTQNNAAEIELARHLLEGAETFDTRVWVAAVAVVMGTLVMLALGTCYLLYKECHLPSLNLDDQEIMELVPNIILNPGFHDDDNSAGVDERFERDENCNDRRALHVNNNSVIHPYRI